MTPEASPGIGSLADKDFWEQDYYWSELELPARPDMEFSFDRCLAQTLEAAAPVTPEARVLEVGCAPAKWMVFYAERFGARIEGIEYSAKGAEISRRNLEACGVTGTIHHADFFECEPTRHDLVLSIGFIEHFDDLERVFARHLEFLAPRGRLVVGVPNFRGFNALLQRWSDPAYLALHNQRAMEPGLYRSLAASHGLEIEAIDYIGGFDPAIIKLGRRSAGAVTLIESGYRRLSIADRINHRWGSSYLFTCMRAPA